MTPSASSTSSCSPSNAVKGFTHWELIVVVSPMRVICAAMEVTETFAPPVLVWWPVEAV